MCSSDLLCPCLPLPCFGCNKDHAEAPDIKPIMPLIGYEKISLENHRIVKQNPDMMLDASAIAQGLSADLIAELFEKHGCKNYMIDIGGEIVLKVITI